MKLVTLFVLQLMVATCIFAQIPTDQNTTYINGFETKISGPDYSYYSSISVAKDGMLIRADNGTSNMEWETEMLPKSIETEYVTFVWLAGIGSSPGLASFEIEINNDKHFTFWADGSNEWMLNDSEDASLFFRKDMIDQYGDRFGFMYLTLPVTYLVEGKSLNIKSTGSNSNKTSWFMIFSLPLKDGLNFKTLPALVDKDEKSYQLGVAGILYFGKSTKAKVFIDDKLLVETPVTFGYNYVKVHIPSVTDSKTVNYRIELDDKKWVGQLEMNQVRKWRVNFVQHSHTDIGYTRSQTDILAEHLRFIDYALDYCDMTDDFPEEARFRWTCEASWAVDEFLKCRPQTQIDRFKARVAEGRIEITGMFFNFDELPDEQVLAASLQPVKNFKAEGLQVKTAMQNDVNGIAWCLNDYYYELGVSYLNMGTHGHRALICFDKPTLFWWESPSEKRMLAYRAEHYMTGNTKFKIHTGDFNVFEEELLSYLVDLEAKGYEYDLISIQHSGYLTDNSPPSTHASNVIRMWNEKYSWPKLRTATATAFFEEMEKSHGDDFQVIRGAWPDWWTDGFGASAREVAATRTAQADLIAATSGLSMVAMHGSKLPVKIADRIESANSALLFYTEHTVGYHASVREPFHTYTMEQRSIKESYAWEASRRAKMLNEETMGLLQSYFNREKEPSVIVFNTLNWTRSGYFVAYIDHQILPRYTGFSITGHDGKQAKAQPLEHHSDGTYWAIWVDKIPAFGYKKFIIRTDESLSSALPKGENNNSFIYENQWYRVEIDPNRAAVSSLWDKTLDKELVDKSSPWMLGEFIYETLDNREQMENRKLDSFDRVTLDSAWFDGYEESEIWNTIRCRGNTNAATKAGAFEASIRIFNTTKRIDFVYFIEKKLETNPEGIYVSFPLLLENGQLSFDVQGGEIRAGIDQIPGSSNDWNTVQHYARLSNNAEQLILTSKEAPLMQFGGINTGRYVAGATPKSTHIFGWPMNNYWVTNFNADQHGGHNWTYSLTSTGDKEVENAVRFGWENSIPFLSRVLPGGGNGDAVFESSWIEGWADNILLISAIPSQDGTSVRFHLREIAGAKSRLELINKLSGKMLNLTQVDVTGQTIENGNMNFEPYESKFFRLDL
ncbi:MAG: hypothetical protein FD155_1225 [Bacteroidetes bacterium]|nr:MAG: hypothetical protein FD155_1225 [Bacteroidota bacterium]